MRRRSNLRQRHKIMLRVVLHDDMNAFRRTITYSSQEHLCGKSSNSVIPQATVVILYCVRSAWRRPELFDGASEASRLDVSRLSMVSGAVVKLRPTNPGANTVRRTPEHSLAFVHRGCENWRSSKSKCGTKYKQLVIVYGAKSWKWWGTLVP